MTLTQAARLLKVSPSSVSRAKRLQSKGAPEVIAAVDSGVLLLNTALPLLRLPRDAQAAALADVMRAGGGKRLPEATMRSILRQYQSDAAPAYQPKSRVGPTGRVGALTAQVAALEEELGAAVVQVVALDEDKRAALAQVADLKVKVAALEAQVAALGEDNRTLREGLRSPIEAFLLLLGQPVAAQGTNGHAVPVSVEGQGDSDDIPF
jgi:hypothetical protein